MSDATGEHSQTAKGPARESRLTERLLARGTLPLGLIDVRRAESYYARIMDWLAARTPLLEHLKARYGLAEGEGLKGLSLAFADARTWEGEHADGGPINFSAVGGGVTLADGQGALAERSVEGLVTYVAHVPEARAEQAEAKRIARRGFPTFSSADPVMQHRDAGMRTHPDETARPQQSGSVTQGGSAPTIPVHGGSSLELAGSHPEQAGAHPERGGTNVEVLRGSHAAPSVKEIPAATGEAHDARGDGAPLTPPRTASVATPESTQLPTLQLAQSAEGRATTPTAEPDKGLEPARGRPGVPSVKELPVAQTRAGSEMQKPLTSAGVLLPARPDSPGGYGAPGDDALAPASPTRAAVDVREMRAPDAPAESPLPLARARELPTESSRSEAPLPLAANPVSVERGESVGRQNDSVAAAKATQVPAAVAMMQVPPVVAETITPGGNGRGAQAGGVNVERLTEQVSRHLARRLLVERERRRMGGR